MNGRTSSLVDVISGGPGETEVVQNVLVLNYLKILKMVVGFTN